MPGIDVQSLLMALKGRPGGVAEGGRTNPIDAMQQRILELLSSQMPAAPGGGLPAGGGGINIGALMGGRPPEPDMPAGDGGGIDMEALQGLQDPRGMVGEFSRGANVYPGGGPAMSGGGDQFGAPVGNLNALGGGPDMGSTLGASALSSMMPQRNAILRRIQAQRGNHGLLA